MAIKKWVLRDADKERASALSEKFNIDPFVAFLMVSRGITNDIDAANFLSDEFLISSPFDFADMDEAVFTISESVDAGEKICVYGDYDCDGVTSTALMVDYLRSIGADVCYYIPSRENEGYGLNMPAIDLIHSWGVNLIVTVDNGTTAIQEAEYIYSLGMKLVVTDHHQLADNMLPKAEAVVNPQRDDNDLNFKEYCGVGVAFKLIIAMDEEFAPQIIDKYIDLVAIGTLADVMPLVDENRVFVRKGVEIINSSPRKSIKALISDDKSKTLTSTDVAFHICPRINAVGRMGDAKRAVEFLLCENEEECLSLSNEINHENANRQKVEQDILEDVNQKISANPKLITSPVIVLDGEGYHHGVVGIVSAHLTERYGKPTFVIGIDADGVARGSARSVEGFNIFDAISACCDDLQQYGGHPMAAGITLSPDKIDDFRKHINQYAIENYPIMPNPQLNIDFKIAPSYLTVDLADALSVLEPYGAGNNQAVFGIYNLTITDIAPLSEGKHIRLELQKNNRRIRIVKFKTDISTFPYAIGDVVNCAVKISKNLYREKMYLSIQAVDIRLSDIDDEKYFREKGTYDLYRYCTMADTSLYPEHDDCAVLYRYLKKNNGYSYSKDDLYFRLQKHLTYGKVMFALKAFAQAGLITINENKIILNDVNNKVSLEQTRVLTNLRERLEGGQ